MGAARYGAGFPDCKAPPLPSVVGVAAAASPLPVTTSTVVMVVCAPPGKVDTNVEVRLDVVRGLSSTVCVAIVVPLIIKLANLSEYVRGELV